MHREEATEEKIAKSNLTKANCRDFEQLLAKVLIDVGSSEARKFLRVSLHGAHHPQDRIPGAVQAYKQ